MNEHQSAQVDENYKSAATVVYEEMRQSERACFAIAADYGKWLIASLLLINGGALFGLFGLVGSLAEHGKWEIIASVAAAAWWFVAGLVLALLCGFTTWLNWSLNAHAFNQWAKPAMLWDRTQWPQENVDAGRLVAATYWASLITGWSSIVALVFGAACLIEGASRMN
jgi:hypothetical protein